MQKIATLMYDALEDNSSLNLAAPGGGQHQSVGGQGRGGMGGLTQGTAVKPQFGEAPAQVMIHGVYNANDQNFQPHPEKQLIHAGETLTGPGAIPWIQNPTATTNTGVAALKSAIETDLQANLPAGVTFEVFRIEYSGVVFGDKGYHFP
jgi:hypothetical protein